MSNIDREYHELCREILREGYEYIDESRGIVCKQISSHTIEVDKVFTHFPLITTKKMFTKGIVGELIWFLRGDSNIKYLAQNDIKIWDKDAHNWYKKNYPDGMLQQRNFGKNVINFKTENNSVGDVGRNYGVQWRQWTHAHSTVHSTATVEKLDQITNLIQNLIVKPMSRRHIVTAWNPAEIDETALPPCHWAFEIIPYPIAENIKELLPGYNYFFDLKWHQRSVDTFLGLPFNISSYALLMRIIGELTNMLPNRLYGDLTNVHFYEPHIKLVEEQLQRSPFTHSEPDFEFSERIQERFQHFRDGQATLDEIFNEIEIKDFEFKDYESYPAIEAEMYEPKK